jgi:hypothetical protein
MFFSVKREDPYGILSVVVGIENLIAQAVGD